MWPRLAGILAVAVAATGAEAARARAGEDLLRVVTPASKAVANAHPHVNVIVSFGAARDGTPVDPATFRARLNGRDVTDAFHPVPADGTPTGMRAALPASLLRLVERPRNKLRLSAQAARVRGKGPRLRDVDRVRFGAADGPNQPPVAVLAAGAETARIGVPVAFDASGSHDPDGDELAFAWTFSDGGGAAGPAVSHAFAAPTGAVVRAEVAVSDGVTTATGGVTLPVALTPDPGRTPGVLRIAATEPLELSAVALGASATRTLVLHNEDAAPTSQIKVQVVLDGAPGFGTSAATIELGPAASAPLDVTFAPAAPGHVATRLTLVASAANREAVTFLAHGFGGAAPGDGPTGAAVPVFGVLASEIVRLAPEGGTVVVDNAAGTCSPPDAAGTGDVCVVHGDCATGGEVCAPSGEPVDATSWCSDGRSLFVLAEDSYVDPREDPDTELAATLVRFDLDASGATTGRRVLYRTTEDTTLLACDGFFAGDGGLAYLAEFRNVQDTENCARDERDALVSVNKGTGNARTVAGFSRLDAAASVPECEYRDPVERLDVAPDGVAKYAGFESGGLWRIAPTPLAFSPDVHDGFDLHPDGSVVVVAARDRGTTGTIDLYRLTAAQVEHGALPLAALTPCASFPVPNNTTAAAPTTTIATSLTVAPATLAGRDATALVTFRVRATLPLSDVLPPFGEVRGTVAFSLPADATACSVSGLVSLQALDLAR